MWMNENWEEFETEEEAREDAREKITLDDLADFFHNYRTMREILEWGLKNDAFLEHFQEDLCAAEDDYFHEFYREVEEEEEE